MTQNNFPNGLQYYWVDPTTKAQTQLNLNSSLQIASITIDSTLPSWIKMTGAGIVVHNDFSYGYWIKY